MYPELRVQRWLPRSAAAASVRTLPPPLWARWLMVRGLYAGFFGLGTLVVLVLALVAVQAALVPHMLGLRFCLLAATAAVAVLRAFTTPAETFNPPGIEVTDKEEPGLFTVIREVAAQMKAPLPARVFLIPDVNAYVAEVRGMAGYPGLTRVMAVGVGLLNTDTVNQLRATLAHEFGHLSGGETRLGSCICRVRACINRAVQLLGAGSPLARPFEWYARTFQRITNTMGRQQELAADIHSVRVAGREAHVEGLRREAVGAVLFSNFLRYEVTPLLEEGYRPHSLYEGYRRYLWNLQEDGVVQRVERALQQERTEQHDTHPALSDRIRWAFQIDGPTASEREWRLSRDLLADAHRVEVELTRRMVAAARQEGTHLPPPIGWEQVAGVVHAAKMARVSGMVKRALGLDVCRDVGVLLHMLTASQRDAAARKISPGAFGQDGANLEEVRRSVLLEAAAAVVATALVEQKGYTWSRALGRTLNICSPEGQRLDPYELVRDAVFHPARVDSLRVRLQALGLVF